MNPSSVHGCNGETGHQQKKQHTSKMYRRDKSYSMNLTLPTSKRYRSEKTLLRSIDENGYSSIPDIHTPLFRVRVLRNLVVMKLESR